MHLMSSSARRRLPFLLLLIALFGLAFSWFSSGLPIGVQAAGVTYYVANTGSDTNPGTESQPFRTIQKAANIVNPGDTVIVEDGVYTGSNSCSGNNVIVCLTRGGTSTASVTFRARNRYGAKVQGQLGVNNQGWCFLGSANYITIEGFDTSNVAAISETGGASGFALYSGGRFSRLVHNKIHDIGNICTDTTKGQNGIFVQQPDVTVEANLIYNVGRFAPGEYGCTPLTTNYQNHDHGVYIDGAVDSSTITGANNAKVQNNIFYSIQRGWSIQLYPGSLTNLLIANNTFAFENPYRTGHITVGANLTGARIVNNIFYDPKTAAISYYTGSMTDVVVSNNITHSGVIMSASPNGVTFSSNLDNTDPALVAPLVFDFHLQDVSPSIDRGLALAELADDFDGISRPQGTTFDVGACEKDQGSVSTATPTPTPTPTPAPAPTPTPAPNSPPSVIITSPANSSTFASRSNITISANATDSDGSIAKVDFYSNGTLVGTDTSAPYSIVLKRVRSGAYALTSKATDNLGAATTSAPVSITVGR